jgi:hypothetical protein
MHRSVPNGRQTPEWLLDCDTWISTVLAWNRAYKTPALMNFVNVAREIAGEP